MYVMKNNKRKDIIMLAFACDYMEGAHEKILQRLSETNYEKAPGYGNDIYCESAKEKIRRACECPEADIYFLAGGTQTNAVVIDTMLRKYQGVVAARTGHVNVHEAGAIEYTGHKVLTVPSHEGKLMAGELEEFLRAFWNDGSHEHMVFPGMVYLSHPTEYGTLYSKEELLEIARICREFQILLYLDGARLGYGLMSRKTDVTLPDLARICDVFYIGGTKVGALCGEAVVFTKNNTPEYFLTMVKQHGAMLAKGRLLGIQFDALFTDGLYYELGAHAIEMAERLREGLVKKGYPFFLDSPTNQQFIVLPDVEIARLQKDVYLDLWDKVDADHTVVRFATSWATAKEDVDALLGLL